MRTKLCFLFVLTSIWACAWQSLAGEAAVPRLPLIDADRMRGVAESVTTNAYPDADAVILSDKTYVEYDADGLGFQVNEWYEKVLTEKGRREARTASFWIQSAYGSVTVEVARVIKPDGTAREIDVAANTRVMVDPSQMGANIYDPNSKTMTLTLPGVDIGDVVHIRVRRDTTKARVPGTFSDYFLLEHTSPILDVEYQINAPDALPLRNIVLRDELPDNPVTYLEMPRSDGGTLHVWRAQNVPQAFPEPNMPALHTCVRRVLVSTIDSWADLSKWYWTLCEPRMAATTPEMQQTVDALVAGCATRDEKIRAVFTFVSQKIRYMGVTPEEEAPGYEPHDVSLTFNNKYGVCRDKAALLVAMLRMADIKAFPVLIHAADRKDPDVPQPYFNHAVVAVSAENPDTREGADKYILMDPTNENTASLLPEYLAEKSFLVARSDGEELLETRAISEYKNTVQIFTRGAVGDNNELTAVSTIQFKGVNDTVYRGTFARMQEEDRRRFVERLLQRSVPGARLTEMTLLPADIKDTEQPLSLFLEYSVPDILVVGDDVAMLPLPRLRKAFGYVNYLIGRTGLKERRFPLETETPCGVEDVMIIRIPQEIKELINPKQDMLGAGNVVFFDDVFLSPKEPVVCVRSYFFLAGSRFSPDEYLELRKALQDVEKAERVEPMWQSPGKIAFEKSEPPKSMPPLETPDSRILSKTVAVSPAGGNAWKTVTRVRKEILTYNGKIRNGDMRFYYNPVRETVRLAEAVITNPDGATHAVGALETNVMDQPWVAGAPRYPDGKILVASLPGLEIGSVVDYTVEQTFTNFPFFSHTMMFGDFVPIDFAELRVAKSGACEFADVFVKGVAQNVVTNDADVVEYVWTARDVPATVREDNMPPDDRVFPHVAVSSGDYRAYHAEFAARVKTLAANQPQTEAKARELTAACTNAYDKVKAIRDFVATHIRVAGPAFYTVPFDCIADADTTLALGYGNRADTAVVLYAMLDAIGIVPEILLVDSERFVENGIDPAKDFVLRPNSFDVVLLRVKIKVDSSPQMKRALSEQGFSSFADLKLERKLYLNETSQYGDLTFTKYNKSVFTRDGELAQLNAHDGFVSVVYDAKIGEDGTMLVEVYESYYGMRFESFRMKYEEMTPEQLRRDILETVAGFSKSAELVGEFEIGFEGGKPNRTFTLRIPDWVTDNDGVKTLRLPAAAAHVVSPRVSERQHPFYRDAGLSIVEVWVFTFDEKVEPLVTPEQFSFNDEHYVTYVSLANDHNSTGISMFKSFDAEENSLYLRRVAQLPREMMSPEEYAKYVEAALKMQGRRGDTIIFRKVGE